VDSSHETNESFSLHGAGKLFQGSRIGEPEQTLILAANVRIGRSNLAALEVRDRFSDFSSAVADPGACSCIPTVAVSHVFWQYCQRILA
jgi:hypothetical protein